jgi:hypothetical protein
MVALAVGFFGSKGRRTAGAIAEVVDVHDAPLSSSAGYRHAGTPDWITVKVRVAPVGQPEFESQFRVWGDAVKMIGEGGGGQQTYVLYDPEHPKHCDVDRERLTEEFGSPIGYPGEQRVLIPSVGEAKVLAKQLAQSGATAPPGLERIIEANRRRAEQMWVGAGEPAHAPPPQAPGTLVAEPSALGSEAAPPATQTIEDRLAAIDELHKAGAITDDEFRAKRKQIIDSI